jgi:hypothetical protein
MSDILTLILNAIETVDIIIELHFMSDLNLVRLHIFIVEKTDDDSLVIFYRWLQILDVNQF